MKFTGLKTIILSRFKSNSEEEWVKERREICDTCEFNSKNVKQLDFKQKTAKFLSNLLTLVTTGKFNEDESQCTICFCTLSYKIPEKFENCEKNKWKSIYNPNSAQKKKLKQ